MATGRRGEPTLGSADLTGPEAAAREQRFTDLSSVARTIDQDPTAVPGRLQSLPDQWGANFTIQQGEPIRIGQSTLGRWQSEAAGYTADPANAAIPPARIQQMVADEQFQGLQRSSSNRSEYDPATNTARYPSSVEVYGPSGTRPLNLDDPMERQLATNLARTQVEEATHAAGFTVRDGAYTPLSPDMEGFGKWMGSPEGQAYVRDNPSSDYNRPHEADITSLLQSTSPQTDEALGVYGIRGAYTQYRSGTAH